MKSKLTLIAKIALLTLLFSSTTFLVKATFVEMEKIHTPENDYYLCDEVIQFNITLSVLTQKDGSVLSIKDLKIIDTLPPGLEFIPGNMTSTPTAISFTNYMNGTLVWDFGPGPFTSLPQAHIRFNVTVTNDAPENVYQLNTAKAKYREVPSNVPSNPAVTDTIRVIYPILDIEKTCSGLIHEGGDILYQITLTNTGHLNATNITVTDILPSGVSYDPGTATASSGVLDESQLPNTLSWTGDIGNVSGSNTITINIPVTDNPSIVEPIIQNNATYSEYTKCNKFIKYWDICETPVINPDINIVKECTPSSTYEPANITYYYTVTNTGNAPLTEVYVYDETLDILILGPITLEPAESATGNHTIYNKLAGTYQNIANTTGMDQLGLIVTAHDDAECIINEINSEITLIKDCEASQINEPADITYTYTVTNTGDSKLTEVYVYDETLDILILGPITLEPAESATGTHILYNQSAGLYNNLANATGIDILGGLVMDHDDAVCVIVEEGINPNPGLVGGEIYPAITMIQKVTTISILMLLGALIYISRPKS